PGPDLTPLLVEVQLQVKLQESILEDVFGKCRIAQVASQVVVELAFVATDQLAERPADTAAILVHELFVTQEPKVRASRWCSGHVYDVLPGSVRSAVHG